MNSPRAGRGEISWKLEAGSLKLEAGSWYLADLDYSELS
jgi:hypothetical protein